MALAWNAGWVNALRGSNPLSSAKEAPVTCHGGFLLFIDVAIRPPAQSPALVRAHPSPDQPTRLRINGRSSPSECNKAAFIRWGAATRSG